jgi:hypothetical protein
MRPVRIVSQRTTLRGRGSIASRTGLNLTTDRELDAFGRVKKRTDPNHNITFYSYDDSTDAGDPKDVRVYKGWNTNTNQPTGARSKSCRTIQPTAFAIPSASLGRAVRSLWAPMASRSDRKTCRPPTHIFSRSRARSITSPNSATSDSRALRYNSRYCQMVESSSPIGPVDQAPALGSCATRTSLDGGISFFIFDPTSPNEGAHSVSPQYMRGSSQLRALFSPRRLYVRY